MSHWVPTQRHDDVVYHLQDQEFDRAIDLPDEGKLLIHIEDTKVDFAVLEWWGGPSTDTKTGEVVEPTGYRMAVRGHGFGSPLRECRHTWWGETDNGGYIFYPNFTVIAAAGLALREWFDEI